MKFAGYRPLEEGEPVEGSDWFEGFSGLMAMNGGGRIPEFAKRVNTVPRWLVGSFWRHVLTEERGLGCDHPQTPDDVIPGDWLKDLPCPYPDCPAGQTGGMWHVLLSPPRVSFAIAMDGGIGEYRKITYVAEVVWALDGSRRRKHYQWKLDQ